MCKQDDYLKKILTNKICFDGPYFDWELDYARLKTLMAYVFLVIRDERFRSVKEIESEIKWRFNKSCAQTSISAILRHFRKEKYGRHTVNTRRVEETGLFEYQFVFNTEYGKTMDAGQLELAL